jgi:large subunit ribosomal protein L22
MENKEKHDREKHEENAEHKHEAHEHPHGEHGHEEHAEHKHSEARTEHKHEEHEHPHTHGEHEHKHEEKKEEKPAEAKPAKKEEKRAKRDEAVARGNNVGISKKHSMEIIRMIKGKGIDNAIEMLEEVVKMKRAVPFRGYEIPHKKGMCEGRYPVTAAREILLILKSLKANAVMFSVELDKAVVSGKANDAARPFKRGGSQRFKRTNVELWVRERKANAGGKK